MTGELTYYLSPYLPTHLLGILLVVSKHKACLADELYMYARYIVYHVVLVVITGTLNAGTGYNVYHVVLVMITGTLNAGTGYNVYSGVLVRDKDK